MTDRAVSVEEQDAKRLQETIELLLGGDVLRAEKELLTIVANTPADYVPASADGQETRIKFWDQNAFIHYAAWQQSKGKANLSIVWIPNAYPRAHYYLGFLYVKLKQFDRAIQYLDRGSALEPTNPKFVIEKAQALLQSGRKQEALQLFESIESTSEFVTGNDFACALRGRGIVLIELGRLDEAEQSFRRSLEIQPNNSVALNELRYIAHLRAGGRVTYTESSQTFGPAPTCVMCGGRVGEGRAAMMNGVLTFLCRRCDRRLSKKWWQFWR